MLQERDYFQKSRILCKLRVGMSLKKGAEIFITSFEVPKWANFSNLKAP